MSKLKHSSFGIAAFILSLVPLVFGALVFPSISLIGQGIESLENETLRETLGWMVGLSYLFIGFIIPVLVVIFGVWALLQTNRKKGFAWAGLIIEAFVLFAAALFIFVL